MKPTSNPARYDLTEDECALVQAAESENRPRTVAEVALGEFSGLRRVDPESGFGFDFIDEQSRATYSLFVTRDVRSSASFAVRAASYHRLESNFLVLVFVAPNLKTVEFYGVMKRRTFDRFKTVEDLDGVKTLVVPADKAVPVRVYVPELFPVEEVEVVEKASGIDVTPKRYLGGESR